MVELKLDLFNDYGEISVDLTKIDNLLGIFERNYLGKGKFYFDLNIVGDEKIKELNKTYRGKDVVTDVLSFADGEVNDVFPETGDEKYLGEIIISYPQMLRQAEELKNDQDREFYLLVSHGLLHLLAYDHINEEDAKKMEAEEDRILNELFK